MSSLFQKTKDSVRWSAFAKTTNPARAFERLLSDASYYTISTDGDALLNSTNFGDLLQTIPVHLIGEDMDSYIVAAVEEN